MSTALILQGLETKDPNRKNKWKFSLISSFQKKENSRPLTKTSFQNHYLCLSSLIWSNKHSVSSLHPMDDTFQRSSQSMVAKTHKAGWHGSSVHAYLQSSPSLSSTATAMLSPKPILLMMTNTKSQPMSVRSFLPNQLCMTHMIRISS